MVSSFHVTNEILAKPILAITMIGSICCALLINKVKAVRLKVPLNFIILSIYTLLQSIVTANMIVNATSKTTASVAYTWILKNVKYNLAILFMVILVSFIPSKILDVTYNPFGYASQHLLEAFSLIIFIDMLPQSVDVPYFKFFSNFIKLFLFSYYMLFESQRIIGGKFKQIEYKADEYILASISIYLDFFAIFLTLSGQNILIKIILKYIKFMTKGKKFMKYIELNHPQKFTPIVDYDEHVTFRWSSEYFNNSTELGKSKNNK